VLEVLNKVLGEVSRKFSAKPNHARRVEVP